MGAFHCANRKPVWAAFMGNTLGGACFCTDVSRLDALRLNKDRFAEEFACGGRKTSKEELRV